MKVAELEKKLVFKPKPVFDQISKKEKTELQKFAEEYIKFLSEVKTEREAVEFFVNKLEEKLQII